MPDFSKLSKLIVGKLDGEQTIEHDAVCVRHRRPVTSRRELTNE